jgi:tripartite-type tricarboxylate transporter receptor subunit TctC
MLPISSSSCRIPTRAGPVIGGALSGETQVLSDQYPSSALRMWQRAAWFVRFVAAQERLPTLPQVPTFRELGHPALNDLAITWFGIVAPAGTPQAVVSRLNGAANAALQVPAVQEQLQTMGVQVLGGTPQRLSTMMDETAKVGASRLRERGLTVDKPH